MSQKLVISKLILPRKNAWNKGLTASVDERVKGNVESMTTTKRQQGRTGEVVPWNKDLTKGTDPRVVKNAQALVRAYAEGRVQSHGQATKGGYRADLGHYVRSSWEANFARLLKFLGLDYKYEARRFRFKVGNLDMTYLPDFYIGTLDRYVEVKGFWREADRRRVCLFRETFPGIVLDILGNGEYLELVEKFSRLIPNWEYS